MPLRFDRPGLRFDRPVSVWETISRRRVLTDVEGAARWMIEDWPEKVDRPQSYVPALRACLLALEVNALDEHAPRS